MAGTPFRIPEGEPEAGKYLIRWDAGAPNGSFWLVSTVAVAKCCCAKCPDPVSEEGFTFTYDGNEYTMTWAPPFQGSNGTTAIEIYCLDGQWVIEITENGGMNTYYCKATEVGPNSRPPLDLLCSR